MKTNIGHPFSGGSFKAFKQGIVFGFDMGTNSLGFAVRQNKNWLETGVVTFLDKVGNLEKRRAYRQMRRRTAARKYRRDWLKQQLEKHGFTLPNNTDKFEHPVILRNNAVRGQKLDSAELHIALQHLFKKRGYEYEVPWANVQEDIKGKKDEEITGEKVTAERLEKEGFDYPCEKLFNILQKMAKLKKEGTPEDRIIGFNFERKLIEKEYRRIIETQKKYYPQFDNIVETSKDKITLEDWLLYGNCQIIKVGVNKIPVYDKKTEKDRGVLGIRFAHIYNRALGLDIDSPLDDEGRVLHRIKKSKDIYKRFQFEVAIRNFRVIDAKGNKVIPPKEILEKIREEFNKSKNKQGRNLSVSKLEKILKGTEYKLVEGQNDLNAKSPGDRSSFSSVTLKKWAEITRQGSVPYDNPQPLLRRGGENWETASKRYLNDMAFPLGKHRLEYYIRLLDGLIKKYGNPEFVVIETIRELTLGDKARKEIIKKQADNKLLRDKARDFWAEAGIANPGNPRIRLKRLVEENGWHCPYCQKKIEESEVINDEIELEHIVPQSEVVCNEIFNLTAAHRNCNKKKGEMTPYEAFAHTDKWSYIFKHAQDHYMRKTPKRIETTLKFRLFTEPNARELLRDKYNSPLTQTAYITKAARALSLIRMNWLTADGREPTIEKGNPASMKFMSTNGPTTALLRRNWGINDVLWDLYPESDANIKSKKVRLDVRNHAIDAMVIACTFPPVARFMSSSQAEGYWIQDKDGKPQAINSFDINYDTVKNELDKIKVIPYVPNKRHASHYDSTLLGKRKIIISSKTKQKEEVRFYKRVPVVGSHLKEKQIENGDIYPQALGEYIKTAWRKFKSENENCVFEKTKEQFFNKLCFSHFQRWRALGENMEVENFKWPVKVKIPIRNVRIQSQKNEDAVMEIRPKTYVARTGYKGLAIYKTLEGKRIGIYVPYWKTDAIYEQECKKIPKDSKLLIVLRTNMAIKLKKAITDKKNWAWEEFKIVGLGGPRKNPQINLMPLIFIAKGNEIELVLGAERTSNLKITLNDLLDNLLI